MHDGVSADSMRVFQHLRIRSMEVHIIDDYLVLIVYHGRILNSVNIAPGHKVHAQAHQPIVARDLRVLRERPKVLRKVTLIGRLILQVDQIDLLSQSESTRNQYARTCNQKPKPPPRRKSRIAHDLESPQDEGAGKNAHEGQPYHIYRGIDAGV